MNNCTQLPGIQCPCNTCTSLICELATSYFGKGHVEENEQCLVHLIKLPGDASLKGCFGISWVVHHTSLL